MTLRETVLVLGAGASAPYGFPTGPALVDDIIARFANQVERMIRRGTLDIRYDQRAKSFVERLRTADAESIDAFLEHNPQFQEIGKLAIASHILRAESGGDFFDRNPEVRARQWYRYLWKILAKKGIDGFPSWPLKIVTFNYDRSLEQYFHTTLQSMFGVDDEAAGKCIARLPICHVHGQLGRLPWQSGDGLDVPYGMQLDGCSKEMMDAAMNGISIIHEDLQKRGSIFAARQWLSDAQVIGFLGFGYHPVNMARLVKELDMPSLSVLTGSCLGFTSAEKADLARQMRSLMAGPDAKLDDAGPDNYSFTMPVGQGGSKLVRVRLVDHENLRFLRESPFLFRDV